MNLKELLSLDVCLHACALLIAPPKPFAICANAVDDVLTLMRHGQENRHVGETRLNRESSRSHSVFTCTVEVRCPTVVLFKDRLARMQYSCEPSWRSTSNASPVAPTPCSPAWTRCVPPLFCERTL